MPATPHTWTRLDKAAYDNGFDIEGPRIDAWRTYASSQCSLRIWLGTSVDDTLLVAYSDQPIVAALADLGHPYHGELPPGAAGGRRAASFEALYQLVRRSFQLSRSLPDQPLQTFLSQTAALPKTTEAERMVIQRVGQDIFRQSLIDYWQGRCPLTGLAVVSLLRASHIKPWKDCDSDFERLDVCNGLLLAPHLDAAFDRGYITLDDDGRVVIADALDASARAVLGLGGALPPAPLTADHRKYLRWHRTRVYSVRDDTP